VTLLVDGRFIEGNLAPSEAWAELADEALDEALEEAARTGAGGWTREDWEGIKEDWSDITFKAYVAQRRERDTRERETWEDIGSPGREEAMKRGGELSREVSDKLTRKGAPRPAFTLTNAVIETGSGQRVEVGTIRVVTSHVAAWWIGGRA
jgi:hypothetical protein